MARGLTHRVCRRMLKGGMIDPSDSVPSLPESDVRMRFDASRSQILVLTKTRPQFDSLLETMARAPGAQREDAGEPNTLRYRDVVTTWHERCSAEHVVECLQTAFVNFLILDLRGPEREFIEQRDKAFRLLTALDGVEDVETRYGFHRIMILLSGEGDLIDQTILELGQRGVGHVLRDPSWRSNDRTVGTGTGSGTGSGSENGSEDGSGTRAGTRAESDAVSSFGARVLEQVHLALLRPRRESRALCAAGGGITGIYFEMGALKCLDDCFGRKLVNTFDAYYGISAGAVVTSLMANGYSIDEMMAAVAGVSGGRLPPLSMALFRLGHFDFASALRRGRRAVEALWSTMRDVRKIRSKLSLEGLLFDYLDLVGPPFRGHTFERMLRNALTVPGTTNDFRRMPRKLFVGATDQDARRHVLFGDETHNHIPISVAVQASMSLNPAFSPTELDGRFHEDGAVTRTSNFTEAIQRGAGLVFVLDPFVPYVSRTPGFARDHGVLYNLDQNIRTVSFTRFESARNWALRRHPDVGFYTFLPANRLRQLLSVSPMDHRPYLEIWRGAYLSTLYHVRRVAHRLTGDAAVHGLTLETSRAETVAERLRAVVTRELRLNDFYPDGRIEIIEPPFCLSLSQPSRAPNRASARASVGRGPASAETMRSFSAAWPTAEPLLDPSSKKSAANDRSA
ncbi:MAG: patatin-like phospholipase family protein [Deltaproteobacteria bacterium]|nr:patatin-like phospholipase family protein [Deltaproteobacteria bacterium]